MRRVSFWLSLILIFTIPWENVINVQSMGTITRAIGLLVAVFWLVTVVVTGGFRKLHPFHIALYVFIIWNVVSYFWSMNVQVTLDRLLTYFQLFVMVLIVWDLYTTPEALKAGLQAYVLGAYISVGNTAYNYLARHQAAYLRYAATGFTVDDLGFILAFGIPVAWYLVITLPSGKMNNILKLANLAYIPAAFLAIILTATRAAFVATLVALLFGLLTLTRVKPIVRALILIGVLGSVIVLLPLMPQFSLDRLASTRTDLTGGDWNGRLYIWAKGLDFWAEHPVLGIGTGAFRSALGIRKVAHNSFLSVLVELGIIGFVLFGIILAIVIYEALRQSKWDSIFWLTMLMMWAISASTLTVELRKPTWLFLGLVVVSANPLGRWHESILARKFSGARVIAPNWLGQRQ